MREKDIFCPCCGAPLGRGVRESESEGRLAAIAMTVKWAVHVFSSRGRQVRNIVFHTIWYVAPGIASLLQIFDTAVLIHYQSPADM